MLKPTDVPRAVTAVAIGLLAGITFFLLGMTECFALAMGLIAVGIYIAHSNDESLF